MTPTITRDLMRTEPIGGYGFRCGWWPIIVGGRPTRVYLSVPHGLPLAEQYERVIAAAMHEADAGRLLF